MEYIMIICVSNQLVEVSNFFIAYYDDEIYVVSPMFTDAEFSRK